MEQHLRSERNHLNFRPPIHATSSIPFEETSSSVSQTSLESENFKPVDLFAKIAADTQQQCWDFFSAIQKASAHISTAFSAASSDYKSRFSNTESLPPPLLQNNQIMEECGFSEALHSRVVYLAYLESGWGGGDTGLSMNPLSLRNFLEFWLAIKSEACEPDLVLCSNGNLQAEWFRNANHNLSIEFTRNSSLYVLCDGKNFLHGSDDCLNLFPTLKTRKSNPFTWNSDEA